MHAIFGYTSLVWTLPAMTLSAIVVYRIRSNFRMAKFSKMTGLQAFQKIFSKIEES